MITDIESINETTAADMAEEILNIKKHNGEHKSIRL